MHTAALRYTIEPQNYNGSIEVQSILDIPEKNSGVDRYNSLNQEHIKPISAKVEGSTNIVEVETTQSKIRHLTASRSVCSANGTNIDPSSAGDNLSVVFRTDASPREKIVLEKVVAIHSSKDVEGGDPETAARESLQQIKNFR